MRYSSLASGFALVLAALSSAPAGAHPHVFVTTRAEIIADPAGKATAVRQIWTFDDAYSAFLAQGLDTNKDGKLSREELAELAKVNVESLADSSYFTVVKIGGKPVEFGAPKDYFLESDGKTLTLSYVLPLANAAAFGPAFFLEVYDPTFFVSFGLAEADDAVKLVGAPAGCKMNIRRPPKTAASTLSQMSETFFQGLDGKVGELAGQATSRIHVACP